MKKIPEFFYTTVRKIEPVGGDCVRMYCSIERAGAWEDRATLVVPLAAVLKNAQFIVEFANDMARCGDALSKVLRVH